MRVTHIVVATGALVKQIKVKKIDGQWMALVKAGRGKSFYLPWSSLSAVRDPQRMLFGG